MAALLLQEVEEYVEGDEDEEEDEEEDEVRWPDRQPAHEHSAWHSARHLACVGQRRLADEPAGMHAPLLAAFSFQSRRAGPQLSTSNPLACDCGDVLLPVCSHAAAGLFTCCCRSVHLPLPVCFRSVHL